MFIEILIEIGEFVDIIVWNRYKIRVIQKIYSYILCCPYRAILAEMFINPARWAGLRYISPSGWKN